jgi:hypothetical protein
MERRDLIPSEHSDVPVVTQLLRECEAMARYALASGLRVPAAVLHTVDAGARSVPVGAPPGEESLVEASQASNGPMLKRLVEAHDQLVTIVSPATPRTLLLLSRDRARGKTSLLGPVRLVRYLVAASAAFLFIFLATGLSPDVNTAAGDIFTGSGIPLVINELFLLAAAGIGASFAALFTANRFIAEGTYDPKYESSYAVRFVLGLIAGIVLAELVPVQGEGKDFTRPLLALLGGFSASVVYRVLNRLVGALESLVSGDSTNSTAATRRAAIAEAAQQRVQEQLKLTSGLVTLRQQVGAGASSEVLTASLNRLLDELMPGDVVGSENVDLLPAASSEPTPGAEAEPESVPAGAGVRSQPAS